MFNGSKRINFSLGLAYEHRYTASVIHHNEVDYIIHYFEEQLKCKPPCFYKKQTHKKKNIDYEETDFEFNFNFESLSIPEKIKHGGYGRKNNQEIDIEHLSLTCILNLKKVFLRNLLRTAETKFLFLNKWTYNEYLSIRKNHLLPDDIQMICTFMGNEPKRRSYYPNKLKNICYANKSLLKYQEEMEEVSTMINQVMQATWRERQKCMFMVLNRTYPWLTAFIHTHVPSSNTIVEFVRVSRSIFQIILFYKKKWN